MDTEARGATAAGPRAAARRWTAATRALFGEVPAFGWLLGALAAVLAEYFVGRPLARALGIGRIPLLFGVDVALRDPWLLPGTVAYMLLVYALPAAAVARLSVTVARGITERLLRLPVGLSVLVHLGLLYAGLHLWAGINDYRLLVTRLALIAIMVTISLNVVNGYMGEFSCSHPGFMALGAYVSSIITVLFFVHDSVLGPPLLPTAVGPFLFPLALIAGGAAAAVGSLAVALPSFRTRGDYLAIISLAFMFIVKSTIENVQLIGGSRGFMNQPDWAGLPTVFVWAVLCVAVTNNFVRSTLGKALNAVRDDETAAAHMTVNTRRTKMVAFVFAAFWAGVAGGLFAHVMRYVNPGTFGVQKLAEVLAMLYFGGLNSVIGSIVGAVGFTLFSEALRPLQIYKWIIIPVLLILVMIYRPTGLIAFREFDITRLVKPREKPGKVEHVAAAD